ncbi:MAG: T9SS type A sorting domain-containing protein [Bacteroidota bacterium]|nr:T9SS type A sorting domain-containing protein [Bacteroidota bacterium]
MKKLYFLIASLTFGSFAFAQCTINPALFGPPNNTNYSIIPDTITNLPLAYVAQSYVTDLQFHIKPDTTVNQPVPGTYPITEVHIDSVVGLPAGFSYLPNPSNGTFTTTSATPPGTGYGCVAVTGSPVAGQELGGPYNDGIYPLIVYVTATVEIFSTPVPSASTFEGYKVHIMPANNVPVIENNVFAVNFSAPNPSDIRTDFKFTTPNSGNMQFTMYNVLGSVVKKETVASSKGTNHYVLETASLSAGVYLCSFRMGDAVVTRRITVSH